MSKLTDEHIEAIYKQETGALIDDSPWALVDFSRAIESAATEPLLQRIAELERQLEQARKNAERWDHACKGNNKNINVCSWDADSYEFVGYAMKKEAVDAIADAEIAAMQKGQS